jgi:hypothetical protein
MYCECVSVALNNQHSVTMIHIILSSAACPALQYFPTLSHKLHDFRSNREMLYQFHTFILFFSNLLFVYFLPSTFRSLEFVFTFGIFKQISVGL